MKNINKVFLSGNLTRDAEVKHVTEKFNVTSTSIAVNKSVKQNDGTYADVAQFFDLRLINRAALAPYLTKGKQVIIEGSLNVDKWEKDGQKFTRVYVDVLEVNLCGGRSSDNGAAITPNESAEPMPTGSDGFPEDIPF